MPIRHAILGFLSWKPLSGYELKKLFSDSLSFHWSGNSNQVYGSLLQLHAEGAVTVEVQPGSRRPDRKVYTITESGREELRAWLLGEAALPETRNDFHTRLAWAEALSDAELGGMIQGYERLLEAQILMCEEMARRRREKAQAEETGMSGPARSEREVLLWERIEEGRLEAFRLELAWARRLATDLGLAAEAGAPPQSPI